jgi:hypothetical protein
MLSGYMGELCGVRTKTYTATARTKPHVACPTRSKEKRVCRPVSRVSAVGESLVLLPFSQLDIYCLAPLRIEVVGVFAEARLPYSLAVASPN